MHCALSLLHKTHRETRGSALVGFVTVAPLIVIVSIAIIQSALLGLAHIGLMTAVQAGAQRASTLGGSDSQARSIVVSISHQHGLALVDSDVSVQHVTHGQVSYVTVSAHGSRWMTFIQRSVMLSATSREIDEERYH